MVFENYKIWDVLLQFLNFGIQGEKYEKLPVRITENHLKEQSQKIKDSLANLEKKINDGSHISLKELNHLMYLASSIVIESPRVSWL